MARIDELIDQVPSGTLRSQLSDAVRELRRGKKFGLVYEEHVPETVVLAAEVGLRVGDEVIIRTEPDNRTRYTVESISGSQATIATNDEAWTLDLNDLLVVKPFGDPVYPVLRPKGDPVSLSECKPFHSVINGENFHALQLLLFSHEGQVDCIYIDPPYNTGARDWKYNNDYVDDNDAWQHSKWLSFMEKRLRLAKRLLKPDGVLIVTIDEHELHNLGVLLAESDLFRSYQRSVVTIVIHGRGNDAPNVERVEEYAIFVIPPGPELLSPRAHDSYNSQDANDDAVEDTRTFVRTGNNSTPDVRPGMNYPIWVNEKTGAIRIGSVLRKGATRSIKKVNGEIPIWPVDERGTPRVWRYNPVGAEAALSEGLLNSIWDEKTKRWRLRVTSLKAGSMRHRSVWMDPSHAAKNHGTSLLTDLLGEERFSFPKSLYAVRDCLSAVIARKKDALVLDFFAGSGTTAHAVALLNHADGGQRRCILVTNNEVNEDLATELNSDGWYPGDDEYEKWGICRYVTEPRLRSAFTGIRPDGTRVPGSYADGNSKGDGFKENVVFFDLAYADPDAIEIGSGFSDVLPSLWLASGGVGDPTKMKPGAEWFLSESATFAVLLDEDRFHLFAKEVMLMTQITHLWIVSDSEAAFTRMRSQLPNHLSVGMLYRDYLRNFRVNVGRYS